MGVPFSLGDAWPPVDDPGAPRPELVFCDPPPPRAEMGPWWRRLEPLLEFPGRWVNLTDTYGVPPRKGTVSNLSGRKYRFPPGRWEFVLRRGSAGPAGVFARYLGDDEETGS